MRPCHCQAVNLDRFGPRCVHYVAGGEEHTPRQCLDLWAEPISPLWPPASAEAEAYAELARLAARWRERSGQREPGHVTYTGPGASALVGLFARLAGARTD